jgi:hypothetical protein
MIPRGIREERHGEGSAPTRERPKFMVLMNFGHALDFLSAKASHSFLFPCSPLQFLGSSSVV